MRPISTVAEISLWNVETKHTHTPTYTFRPSDSERAEQWRHINHVEAWTFTLVNKLRRRYFGFFLLKCNNIIYTARSARSMAATKYRNRKNNQYSSFLYKNHIFIFYVTVHCCCCRWNSDKRSEWSDQIERRQLSGWATEKRNSYL